MSITRLVLIIVFVAGLLPNARAQGRGERNLGPASRGENTIYGDLTVSANETPGVKATSYEIVLYPIGGSSQPLAHQTISGNGRYRFNDLLEGDYDIAVLVENNEVTRVRVILRAPT